MTDEQPTSRRAARNAGAGARRRDTPASAPATAPAVPEIDSATGAPVAPAAAPGGLRALIRRHPAAWLAGTIAVAFVVLGTGSVFAGAAVGAAGTPTAPQVDESRIVPRPVPTAPVAATAVRTCSVAEAAGAESLSKLSGAVVDAETGAVLWGRNETKAISVARAVKVLTAAAAIGTLGEDDRIETTVVDGSRPGSVVLIGRGDATLSTMPDGTDSVYEGAPKLSELAEQTVDNYTAAHPDVPLSEVVLDSSFWPESDDWNDDWPSSARGDGTMSRITALQVDGDRKDPTKQSSGRGKDPVKNAGNAFIAALRAADPGGVVDPSISLSSGSAVGDSDELASVESAEIGTLVTQMLVADDDTLAEMLARVTAKDAGFDGTASSVGEVIPSALTEWDIDASGVELRDASGLSADDDVPPAVMAQIMLAVERGTKGLDVVADALGAAGESGPLARRLDGDTAGDVLAAAGASSGVRTLTGSLEADDGTKLGFSFSAVGDDADGDSDDALDELVESVWACGANLSDL